MLLLSFLSAVILTGCGKTDDPVSKSGFYFDTVITVTIYETDSRTERETLLNECLSLCEEYEHLFSRTIEGSDIYRINHANGQPVEVSEETASLLETALYYSRLTNGTFDCSIAPLSDIWDFHRKDTAVPSGQDIAEACSHVDYRKILLRGNTVTLTDPEMALDLGGIAKGYIADQLKAFLVSEGTGSALINLGGNVLAVGSKPVGTAFRIGIQRPFADASDSIAAAALNDQSLVTSGIYERCFEENDILYHHLLDPAGGYPFDNGLYSVTILCESSAEADALSTSCFGLGMEKGMELIESMDDTEALFITEDYQLHYSSGFPR